MNPPDHLMAEHPPGATGRRDVVGLTQPLAQVGATDRRYPEPYDNLIA